jgi:hypothetical protein
VIKQRRVRPDEQVTLVEYRRGEAYTGFCWGNLRKRTLGRPKHIWEDNIGMDLKYRGWGL